MQVRGGLERGVGATAEGRRGDVKKSEARAEARGRGVSRRNASAPTGNAEPQLKTVMTLAWTPLRHISASVVTCTARSS